MTVLRASKAIDLWSPHQGWVYMLCKSLGSTYFY